MGRRHGALLEGNLLKTDPRLERLRGEEALSTKLATHFDDQLTTSRGERKLKITWVVHKNGKSIPNHLHRCYSGIVFSRISFTFFNSAIAMM